VPPLDHNATGEASVLIYETADSGFADLAVETLKENGVDAYSTGGSLPGGSSPTVCIYIRDVSDSPKANEILIKLGAVKGDPDRLPPKWVFAVLAVAAVALALWITRVWK
jgi:hypothetical protein